MPILCENGVTLVPILCENGVTLVTLAIQRFDSSFWWARDKWNKEIKAHEAQDKENKEMKEREETVQKE